jgi:UDP-sugar transporter A1/2/3
MNLKWLSLVILVLHNALTIIIMRYSRVVSSEQYLASTAVVMGEILKLLFSFALYCYENMGKQEALTAHKMMKDLFGPKSCWKEMSLPAILYFIQNILVYKAIIMVINILKLSFSNRHY